MALNANFFNLIDTCCPVGSEYKPKNFGYEIVEHLAGSRIFEFPASGTGGVSIIQAADRTLHQVAFLFSWQPLHFSSRYLLQAPQYKPQ
jgi:hypothetical protein